MGRSIPCPDSLLTITVQAFPHLPARYPALGTDGHQDLALVLAEAAAVLLNPLQLPHWTRMFIWVITEKRNGQTRLDFILFF